jgi:hypothetical protein
MRHSKLNALSVPLASLVGLLSTNCIFGNHSSSPDGGAGGLRAGTGGAGHGGSTVCVFGGASYGQTVCDGSTGTGGAGTGGSTGCVFGGASYGQTVCDAGIGTGTGGTGGSTAGACNSVLFNNGNIYACTNPTDTSVFTLTSASTVTSLSLWTNTNISGQTVSYTLLGPTGSTLAAGPTTKGGCDASQTNWCEFLVSMNVTLAAGTYTVKSSAAATCANSGSNNVGMVVVKGCAASSPPRDAGAGDTPAAGDTAGARDAVGAVDTIVGPASCNLIVNGNAEAAIGSLDGTPVATPGWALLGQATAAQYGANGWPALTDPGPTDRGLNLFSGGPSDATSSLSQTVNVGQLGSSIDGGGVSYLLSGWLGGYSGQDDNATLTVTFQSASGITLGSGSIGPVLSSDRPVGSGLSARSSSGLVPVGTRSVLVLLSMVRVTGTANDGYADNLSLVLSGTGACNGNVTGDGGTTDSRAAGGVADADPTYFTVSTPPTGITAPSGAKLSALKTTTNLGVGGLFWKDGRLFAASSSGGPIVSVMPGETGTLWADVPSLQGGNPSWRHGVPLTGGNILLAIDYYGGPTGLHEITPIGGDTAWTLAQGHSGIGDIVALASGGWVFSDFESYNIYKVLAKNAAETALIPAGAPFYSPGYLAYDALTDTLYFVNMNNLGSEPWFSGDGAIYKLTTSAPGAPTLVASAAAGTRFAGLAIGLGGLFPAGLYAADPANSRVVKVESSGTLTPVIAGVPTPGEIRIDPVSKGMALLSADQVLFVLP